MHQYMILPTDQSFSSAQVQMSDPGGILAYVSRLDCREADVLQDGRYVFSVRKSGGANFWHIFQRPDGEDVYPELG